jgi:hypothetical protein
VTRGCARTASRRRRGRRRSARRRALRPACSSTRRAADSARSRTPRPALRATPRPIDELAALQWANPRCGGRRGRLPGAPWLRHVHDTARRKTRGRHRDLMRFTRRFRHRRPA